MERPICIAGKNKIAVEAMSYLLECGYSKDLIFACCNKNDNGEDNWQPSFRRFCMQNEIPIKKLEQLYDLHDLLFLSLEYDQIIKPDLFKTNSLFNIHFSKLPKYKGMYTSVFPILNGDIEAGVTLHRIDHGIDTGEIIDQISFKLNGELKAIQLYSLFIDKSIQLFEKNFSCLLEKTFELTPQRTENSSYFSKCSLNFDEKNIDFRRTSFQVRNWIHALNFRPYQMPQFEGKNISHAKILDQRSINKPGVRNWKNDKVVDVSTIDYDIRLYVDRIDEILFACEKDDFCFLNDRIAEGYDINDWGKNGWTPLIVSVFNHSVKSINILLNSGANIHATNFKGTSVLMYAMTKASETGDISVLQKLLKRGCKVTQKDYKGISLIEYAKMLNKSEVLNLFINANN